MVRVHDAAILEPFSWTHSGESASKEKLKECKRAAVYLKKLLERDIKPRYAWLYDLFSRLYSGSYFRIVTSSHGTRS